MSETSKPKRRWMPVLLVVSLAINLLVVGAVVGTMVRVKGGDRGKAPPPFASALYRALPKAERKALRGALLDQHRQGSSRRADGFDALTMALQAQPFDPAAVQALLQQQAQSMIQTQSALQEQWLLRVTAMSDKERMDYANRLEDMIRRGPEKRR